MHSMYSLSLFAVAVRVKGRREGRREERKENILFQNEIVDYTHTSP